MTIFLFSSYAVSETFSVSSVSVGTNRGQSARDSPPFTSLQRSSFVFMVYNLSHLEVNIVIIWPEVNIFVS